MQISANNNKERDDSANSAEMDTGTVLQRFLHLNGKDIVKMKKTKVVKDLGFEDNDISFSCEALISGKMQQTLFSTKGHEKTTEVCGLVHGEIGGLGKSLYLETYLLTKQCSSVTHLTLLKESSTHVTHFKLSWKF